ncbi:MAG: enoyl-CoA hydratase/isomerase family protein [Burkholderiaceae bacterium]|nr:enoyl-CoA hydratase/isomerase family protein [Burkholderiaceae bacterium]
MNASAPVVVLHQDGPVLHLTLNRPAQRNAMSLQMVRELRAALQAAEHDAATRVVVLRGAGGHFCAGGDIADMAAARARLAAEPDALARTNAEFGELCLAYACTGLAVVVVAEGTVMGGGFGLACVADVAIAVDGAQFRLPETSLGLVPAQIAPFLVERLGYSEAKRLALGGERLDARAALALRLVHEACAPDQLEATLARVLRGLLQAAPAAVAATKALLARARWEPAAGLVPEAAALFSQAALGPEGAEGTLAFLQKRPARWMPQG